MFRLLNFILANLLMPNILLNTKRKYTIFVVFYMHKICALYA